MYRETVHGADGTERTCEIETTATIAALSIDLVWCDLEPVDRTAPEAVALGRPRVHVMKADAARLLGLPWPPAAE